MKYEKSMAPVPNIYVALVAENILLVHKAARYDLLGSTRYMDIKQRLATFRSPRIVSFLIPDVCSR